MTGLKKPIIFFSHSTVDKDILIKLKNILVSKTGNALEVFLSSDGQSIQFGKNWVHRIQEALDTASMMFVFLTPNSIQSNWIFFEAGYAYSKGITVVPVGFLGTDLNQIAPPLSLLQGFNITNQDSLNNLISTINKEYGFTFNDVFTEEEYIDLTGLSNPYITHPLGEYSEFIDEISVTLADNSNLACDISDVLSKSKEILTNQSIEYSEHQHRIDCFGLTMHERMDQSRNLNLRDAMKVRKPLSIDFTIDPLLLELTIPLIIEILKEIYTNGVTGIVFKFKFLDKVYSVDPRHKLTALFHNSAIVFDKESNRGNFSYENLEFNIGNNALFIIPKVNDFDLKKVFELLQILFNKKALKKT